MASINKLKDNNGNDIYPITSTDAIYTNEGKTISEYIEYIQRFNNMLVEYETVSNIIRNKLIASLNENNITYDENGSVSDLLNYFTSNGNTGGSTELVELKIPQYNYMPDVEIISEGIGGIGPSETYTYSQVINGYTGLGSFLVYWRHQLGTSSSEIEVVVRTFDPDGNLLTMSRNSGQIGDDSLEVAADTYIEDGMTFEVKVFWDTYTASDEIMLMILFGGDYA